LVGLITVVYLLKNCCKLPFQLAEYYRQYLAWSRTSADLIRDRHRKWWLHVVMETVTPVVVPTEETVGVDLGIKVRIVG